MSGADGIQNVSPSTAGKWEAVTAADVDLPHGTASGFIILGTAGTVEVMQEDGTITSLPNTLIVGKEYFLAIKQIRAASSATSIFAIYPR